MKDENKEYRDEIERLKKGRISKKISFTKIYKKLPIFLLVWVLLGVISIVIGVLVTKTPIDGHRDGLISALISIMPLHIKILFLVLVSGIPISLAICCINWLVGIFTNSGDIVFDKIDINSISHPYDDLWGGIGHPQGYHTPDDPYSSV
jgi:hypothetical protein